MGKRYPLYIGWACTGRPGKDGQIFARREYRNGGNVVRKLSMEVTAPRAITHLNAIFADLRAGSATVDAEAMNGPEFH